MRLRFLGIQQRSRSALQTGLGALMLALTLGAFGIQPAMAHAGLDESIRQLSERLVQRPGDPDLLLKRARLHLRHGDGDLAKADIDAAAVSAGPRETAYVVGLYHMEAQDYRAAVSAFGDYLDLHPDHLHSLHSRARAHERLGLVQQSIDDYQRLLAVSPNPSPDYYLELAAIEAGLRPDGLQHALQSLDRGIARLGPLVSLQQTAIEYEMARQNYAAALQRHLVLRPWLGKTSQWQALHRTLVAKAQPGNDGEILPD